MQTVVTVTSTSTGYRQPAVVDNLDYRLGLFDGAGLHSPQELAKRVIPIVDEHEELAPDVREAVRRQSKSWREAWNQYVSKPRIINRSKFHAWYLKV